MSTHDTGPEEQAANSKAGSNLEQVGATAEEQAAEVLAGHYWLGSDEQKIDGEWVWGFDCECGEFVPDGQTNAHLAKALAPLFAEHARQAAATEALAICNETHGSAGNAATVYGHHASVRTCIRLYGSDTWVYDPRWETR